MSSPYRSASLQAPQSFVATAARNVAYWSIGLRAIAALVEAWAGREAAFERPATALVLGSCAALSIAGWRLSRVLANGAARAAAIVACLLGAGVVAAWQPLIGGARDNVWFVEVGSPSIVSGVWAASTWIAAVLLWLAARAVPVAAGSSLTEALAIERADEARAAQAQALRTLSSSVLGVVVAMVLSIVVAIGFEGGGFHWHVSAAIRGAGMVLAALFTIRSLRAISRLQSWAPSIAALSGGLALWITAGVGSLYVLREWVKVVTLASGMTHIRGAFAAQGAVACVTLTALALVFWATRSLAHRGAGAGARWSASSWIVLLGVPVTSAMMLRVHATIPDFIMRTQEHRTMVYGTLIAAAVSVVALFRSGTNVARALEQKTSPAVHEGG